MKLRTIQSPSRLLGLLAIVLASIVTAHAQAADEPAGSAGQQREVSQTTKSESASAEVKNLRSQVDRLQLLVEQQQRALAEMQKRVDDLSARAAPVVTNGPDGKPVVSNDLRAASLETNTAAKPSAAQAPAKAPDNHVVVAGWDQNHAFLRSADGRFETQISGYGQLDYRGYQSGN
ncbi:MAG TPA: hypothetical protein VJZ91_19890, partial [Blastocatellia bacterium]|nr:hypothetical protein [Blastocatellia bacterium]